MSRTPLHDHPTSRFLDMYWYSLDEWHKLQSHTVCKIEGDYWILNHYVYIKDVFKYYNIANCSTYAVNIMWLQLIKVKSNVLAVPLMQGWVCGQVACAFKFFIFLHNLTCPPARGVEPAWLYLACALTTTEAERRSFTVLFQLDKHLTPLSFYHSDAKKPRRKRTARS